MSTTNIQKELWMPVPILGYGDNYLISNYGKLKTVDRFVKRTDGYISEKKSKNVTIFKNQSGYETASLCKKNSKIKIFIHRIVAMAFIENKENKSQVNHKNGIRHDNNVDNLEWCTPKENVNHSYKILGKKHNCIGLFNKGGKKVAMYNLNGELECVFDSTMDVQRKKNIHNSKISANCLGKISKTNGYIFKYFTENALKKIPTSVI